MTQLFFLIPGGFNAAAPVFSFVTWTFSFLEMSLPCSFGGIVPCGARTVVWFVKVWDEVGVRMKHQKHMVLFWTSFRTVGTQQSSLHVFE